MSPNGGIFFWKKYETITNILRNKQSNLFVGWLSASFQVDERFLESG